MRENSDFLGFPGRRWLVANSLSVEARAEIPTASRLEVRVVVSLPPLRPRPLLYARDVPGRISEDFGLAKGHLGCTPKSGGLWQECRAHSRLVVKPLGRSIPRNYQKSAGRETCRGEICPRSAVAQIEKASHWLFKIGFFK